MKNAMQQIVYSNPMVSQTKDNASFTSNVVDTKGFDYAEFIAFITFADVALTVFKIMASDTKANATTLGGTPEEIINFDQKPGADDDGNVFIGGVDLVNMKVPRYIQLQATAGDGTSGVIMAAICALGGRKISGSGKTERQCEYVQYNTPVVT